MHIRRRIGRWARCLASLLLLAGLSRVAEAGGDAETNESELAVVRVDADGRVFWNGERIDTNTLPGRLRSLDENDRIALYGRITSENRRAADTRVFESIARAGIPMVVVEDGDDASIALPATRSDQPRPLTLNTMNLRRALDLHSRARGRGDAGSSIGGPDVVLRFDSDDESGYTLRKVEVGIVGRAVWIVHEDLGEEEAATSLQLRRNW